MLQKVRAFLVEPGLDHHCGFGPRSSDTPGKPQCLSQGEGHGPWSGLLRDDLLGLGSLGSSEPHPHVCTVEQSCVLPSRALGEHWELCKAVRPSQQRLQTASGGQAL